MSLFLVTLSLLLILLAFAPSSALAAPCASPNVCLTSCSGSLVAGDCTGSQVCCEPVDSIPVGSYGCAFKLTNATPGPDGTIVIPPEDMLISCGDGAICVPDKNVNVQLVNGAPEYFNALCVSTNNQCPVCPDGYHITSNNNCISSANPNPVPFATITPCAANQGCSPGYGCGVAGPTPPPQPLSICDNGTSCPTAIGNLPTNLSALLTRVFSIALALAGVVALALIIASGYRLMISQGNPEQVKGAREQLTAAIVGLLFIIFSLVILQVISANILKIPGFS